jgi:phosphatidylserine/phosphatidylglycerophosphate/cardiolipin synthase-like enzyme
VPTFVPAFDPTATMLGEVALSLPDPDRAPSPAVVHRSGVARFAGRRLQFLHVELLTSTLRAPARCAIRHVETDPTTLPGDVDTLIELSPIPFGAGAVLRSLRGVPTFYVAATGITASNDSIIAADTVLAPGAPGALIAAVFPDAIELAPYAWWQLIGDALAAAGDAGAADWRAWLLSSYGSRRHCRVVDHGGRPLAGASFTVERRTFDGTQRAIRTVVLGDDADLETALTGGDPASLYDPPAGEEIAIRWSGEPTTDGPLPVHVFYESGISAAPGAALVVPPGPPPRRTLQVLDVARWYPPREGTFANPLARFHTGCRVEPLVDGIETLRRLAADLRAATGPGNGAQLAGWAFNEFALDSARSDDDIVDLLRAIHDSGGVARVLANRFVNLRNPDLEEIEELAVTVALLLVDGKLLYDIVTHLLPRLLERTSRWLMTAAVMTPLVLMALTQLLLVPGIIELIRDRYAEISGDTMGRLNEAVGQTIAIHSTNPMPLADNPLVPDDDAPLAGIEDDVDQFGVWHNKMQLVKRETTVDDDGHVAYVGGIDINRNRLDSPGHGIALPYHDVHARVTGPVVSDYFTSFQERWQHDSAREGGVPSTLATPTADDLTVRPSQHIARLGRTIYRPLDPSSAPLSFAPDGDRSTYDTLLAAIDAARTYIYIEDQYFTPDDAYIDHLLEARHHCQRLLIVVPSEGDQPYGDVRRRQLIARLRGTSADDGWGTRLLVGFPQRRTILPPAGTAASEGRLWLAAPCSASDDDILVGPDKRVMPMPAWLWIEGELVLAVGASLEIIDEVRYHRLAVIRGQSAGQPRWSAHRRDHLAVGTPVTAAAVKGIYIHAKTMMIDDVFVSIGSANLNRRGFFSDGEINVFAIPQALHASDDNPARSLRTALWAEHLGLPPAMGPTLLTDAVAAVDQFWRPHLAGNRFTPYEASDLRSLYVQSGALAALLPALLAAVNIAIGNSPEELDFVLRRAWNLVVDPPSQSDPDPTEGPV